MRNASTLMASFALVALLGMIVVPASVNAGPLDSYFILGEWKYEGDGYTSSITFKIGGSGESTYEYDGSTTTSEFNWKIDGGELFIKDTDEDDWGSGTPIEFSGFYTKFSVEDSDHDYKKTGSVCGVCCPFPFMFIGAPALLALGAIKVYNRKE